MRNVFPDAFSYWHHNWYCPPCDTFSFSHQTELLAEANYLDHLAAEHLYGGSVIGIRKIGRRSRSYAPILDARYSTDPVPTRRRRDSPLNFP